MHGHAELPDSPRIPHVPAEKNVLNSHTFYMLTYVYWLCVAGGKSAATAPTGGAGVVGRQPSTVLFLLVSALLAAAFSVLA
jgi:hypothetical protein